MKQELTAICKDGVLRAAINTGNRALVQDIDGQLMGVSPALARRLAEQLGVTFEPVVYAGAGKVFADAASNRWDIAFLAIDETRARQDSFTRAYHVIEATYAVRSGSAFQAVSDVDRVGVQIVAAKGSAYDMYLTDTLKHAQLAYAATPPDSFAAFRAGQGDVVAGVRASLDGYFGDEVGYRILPGALTQVSQAMVLPGRDNPKIMALDAFVAAAIADGFVAKELKS